MVGGAAQVTFQLPTKIPLAGYSRRKGKPSQGVHDPVGARALVVADGATTVALVSCDLLIVDERLFDTVQHRLLSTGLPKDLVLVLAATHTHSGPGAYGTKYFEKISMGHFDPVVFEAIVAAVVRAVGQAYEARQPITFGCAKTVTVGLVKNRIDPNGVVDPALTVCRVSSQDDQPIAVLVNFAAHPTTLGAWNLQLSADYPGVVMREIEQQAPEAICLFFAGAVGDQAPVKEGDGFERAQRIGQPLAQQVQALLTQLQTGSPPALHAHQQHLALPPARVRLGRRLTLPRWLSRRLADDDATLSLVSLGPAVFFGAPCDLGAALGQRLKAVAVDRHLEPFIIGFASDYIGYCVPESTYRTGEYEALMAFNGPSAGELIARRLVQMLDEMAATSDPSTSLGAGK